MSLTVQDADSLDLEIPFKGCEARLGYVFNNKQLLREALTHSSVADSRLSSNERLEFLGDAILGAVVCEQLYREYPQNLEGDMTRIKSAVVSRNTCAKVSRSLALDEFLLLGKGMTGGGSIPSSLMSDVYEALVAAIYLDGGMDPARAFVLKTLGEEIDHVASGSNCVNYKSQLQQFVQKEAGETPAYELLDEKGPDHSKAFQVAAVVRGHQFTPAWGRNKKEAEQRAAQNALCELKGEAPPCAET